MQFDELTSMSLKNRIIGFGASVLLGILFGFISYSALSMANFKMFAIFYSLTNLIFLGGYGKKGEVKASYIIIIHLQNGFHCRSCETNQINVHTGTDNVQFNLFSGNNRRNLNRPQSNRGHIVKFRLFHLFLNVAKIGVMLDLVLCASAKFGLVHPFVRSIRARINFENDRNINK